MNCKKIRELLLTDHLDKESEERIRASVQKHLSKCAECRNFQEEIQLAAVEPFKSCSSPGVPEAVWLNIKERITERESRKISLLDAIKERLKVFSLPKPAFALASTMIILLIMAGVITKYSADKSSVRDYFAQQIGFYSVLNSGEENGGQNNNTDIGASIEKYFF